MMYTRLEARLADAKAKLARAGTAAGSKAKEAALTATEYAKENPWKVAAGVAVLAVGVGLLITALNRD